ncbi:MAG: DUF1566 domain-containing protein [Desulfoprunum sp.]|nr:DUF1566 domain-containing protein [Desulfoprunum sp.]
MGMFHKVQVGQMIITPIDWEMNPDLSFGTFESWGGRERVRNNKECVYYFFIDNWGEEPRLCLMERAVKHAKIMAVINAPLDMVKRCVESQGTSSRFEKSYAINEQIRVWLIDHVLDDGDSSLVIPMEEKRILEDMGPALPPQTVMDFSGEETLLPAVSAIINDDQVQGIIKKWGFFDAEFNPGGNFENTLIQSGHPLTVLDRRTALLWQRGGLDICSMRTMQKNIDVINREGLAGYHDWRLPTLEEALSLMERVENSKGVHLHPCFSKEQPFIFVAAQRKPGGYWFVDYKQGRSFWSSGTIPGGFGRLVRSM